MLKILKEPLLIFLLLGGALFFLYQQVSEESGFDPNQLDEIVVTQGQMDALIQGFEKVWQRLPTEIEMEGLIESYIREEIFYREALAMGLDRDDAIVRRRLKQKLEFLTEDLADLNEPDDPVLQAFLDENLEDYQPATTFSFQQVYLGEDESNSAGALLVQLQANQIDPAEAGDSQLMQYSFTSAPDYNVQRSFGLGFLEGLRELEVGSWQGPVRSGFGLHLVNISERIDGGTPQLSEVRDPVFRDWSAQNRKETNKAFYDALRSRYKITIEAAESTE